eukprot:TRINITY_DN2033_c0_g1_i2.p1 TRINITY_DN2033_c0_g1~~TRINITY_DN2033_c0_g1_i2.p1  ORF type:complete len:868 (+),score=240.83 TRINITY_DN2033_c0_g1_i2:81-2684(+)
MRAVVVPRFLAAAAEAAVQGALLLYFVYKAYALRLYAVRGYGRVIHEFDPWFNFRATQYLADHGWTAFFHWFDYMSWYPLGRPIGTTIYPGMQIAAVWIWEALKHIPKLRFAVPSTVLGVGIPMIAGKWRLQPMSLNDVCVFVPAWFGALASVLVGLLTAEASGSKWAGTFATGVMAIIPAHMMRSVAGGFDNESVAVSAWSLTLWLWCRSVRTPASWPWGLLAGLAYVTMAASWGGYIAVCNMIAAHAALLVALGHYSSGLYRAYTLWFVVGNLGAMRVPVIGWTPLRSLEQAAPLAVFAVMQLLEGCDWQRRRRPMRPLHFFFFRVKVFFLFGVAGGLAAYALLLLGYWQPLSSRIRGLIIRHTRTGNPLVDSVSEHQPGSEQSYQQYLHLAKDLAPLGLAMALLFGGALYGRARGSLFLLTHAAVAYFFSLKMSRLIIICGPICSALSGVAVGYVCDFTLHQVRAALSEITGLGRAEPPAEPEAPTPAPAASAAGSAVAKGRGSKKAGAKANEEAKPSAPSPPDQAGVRTGGINSIARWALQTVVAIPAVAAAIYRVRRAAWQARSLAYQARYVTAACRLAIVAIIAWQAWLQVPPRVAEFQQHCDLVARQFSNPRIMFKANGGKIIDDYREGYWWLRDHTPEDSRVMSWWDYGYQITGIGNRTTIADGNTWNHEHIATLGRCLTSPEARAYRMVRHLADYVLVWAGGHKDDLAKSPHMARIGNSVYSDICPGDPKCTRYGFMQDGEPTPMMAASLLYKLHSHDAKPKVRANPKMFKHVFTSTHGLVRIFEVQNVSTKSKAWVADPANRVCDAPGSWYCPGQYPPAFRKLIKDRQDFAQLEDFNKNQGKKSEYTRFVHSRGGEL